MAPPTKKSWHQKIQKNILYQIAIMSFIHISNRWAIISKCVSAPPRSILVPLLSTAYHEFPSYRGKLKRKVKQEVREAFGALQVHSVQCGGPYHPSWVVLCMMGVYSYPQPFAAKHKKVIGR